MGSIVVTSRVGPAALEAIRAEAAGRAVIPCPADEAGRHLPQAEILFGHLPAGRYDELLAAAPHLRWWHAPWAGVEREVAVEAVRNGRVTLTNSRGMHADTIGDHVLMLVLAHFRLLPRFVAQQRQGLWQGPGRGERDVEELAGSTLGIVGLGGIGRGVAARARACGMRVVATRRHPCPEAGIDLVLGPDRESLYRLLGEARVVVVACPLTAETRGLIDAEAFRRMRPDAFLVNIARGPVVDTAALVDALRAGCIGGAGLDCTDPEPLPAGHPLWDCPNAIITPHVAGHQRDYMGKATGVFVENLRRYNAGRPLGNRVDPRLGY